MVRYSTMDSSKNLKSEASAFDRRIEERIKAGFIPDVRRAVKCDYFYKSFFRDPYFMKLYLGNEINYLISKIDKFSHPGAKVLEIGCGPGYVSLETARAGYHVTGIDVSEKAIEIAKKTASSNPYKDGFGSLAFEVSPFEKFEGLFDVVLIRGAIHHMSEPKIVIEKIIQHLNPDGILVCTEPSRERWRKQDAAQVALMRGLLSLTGNWYEESLGEEILEPNQFEEYIDEVYLEYFEQHDKNELGGQSPNDNSSEGPEILNSLRENLTELEYTNGISYIYRMLGGIRGPEDIAHKIGKFLAMYDKTCVDAGYMEPNSYFFVGKKLQH